MVNCNIAVQNVAIAGNNVMCHQIDSDDAEIVRITGSSTTNTVSIDQSTVTIELLNVFIEQNFPVRVSASTISIVSVGASELIGKQSTGIACQDGSNLTFSSSLSGSLSAKGANTYAGIGPSVSGKCGSLSFVNGTYHVQTATSSETEGAAGLGCSSMSVLDKLTILEADINAVGAYGGGIGSGKALSGTKSTVTSLNILGGTISASGVRGAGIGSGSSFGGESSVSRLMIAGGTIRAIGSDGAGIGSGYGYGGTSSVGNPSIVGGNITARATQEGAGIGSGHGYTSAPSTLSSSVSKLIIVGGNISANEHWSSGCHGHRRFRWKYHRNWVWWRWYWIWLRC
jgi:hypothetical protein